MGWRLGGVGGGVFLKLGGGGGGGGKVCPEDFFDVFNIKLKGKTNFMHIL